MFEKFGIKVEYLQVIRQRNRSIKHEKNTSFRPLIEWTVQEKSNNNLYIYILYISHSPINALFIELGNV
jgi:hypothetical protein